MSNCWSHVYLNLQSGVLLVWYFMWQDMVACPYIDPATISCSGNTPDCKFRETCCGQQRHHISRNMSCHNTIFKQTSCGQQVHVWQVSKLCHVVPPEKSWLSGCEPKPLLCGRIIYLMWYGYLMPQTDLPVTELLSQSTACCGFAQLIPVITGQANLVP